MFFVKIDEHNNPCPESKPKSYVFDWFKFHKENRECNRRAKIIRAIEEYFCLVAAYKILATSTEVYIGIALREKAMLVGLYY